MEETEKKDKKEAIIVDDSVTKHVIGLDISLEIEIVKVRQLHGATTDDIIDQVKPAIFKKDDLVIIYSVRNGIRNEVNQQLDKNYQGGR